MASKEFLEGRAAFLRGADYFTACPYVASTREMLDWCDGFNGALAWTR